MADTIGACAAEQQPALLPDSSPRVAASALNGQGVQGGTSSGVLWSTLRAAYARLGFGILADEVFEQVVLARLIESTSKLDTIGVLKGLGLDPPHHTRIAGKRGH